MGVLLDVFVIRGFPPPYKDDALQDPMLQTLHIRSSSEKFKGIFDSLLLIVGSLPRAISVLESLSKGLTGRRGILNCAKTMSVKPAV